MSHTSDAYESLFEAQRQFIEGGRRLAERNVALQRRAATMGLRSFDRADAAGRRGFELWRTTAGALLTAGVPGDEEGSAVRRADAAFDDLERSRAALVEAVRRSLEANDEVAANVADAYLETVDDAAQRFRDEAEHARLRVGGPAETELPGRIPGVTPGQGGSLAEAGVETVAQLAETNAELVAEVADVTEREADEWVRHAQHLRGDIADLEGVEADAIVRFAEAGIETRGQLAAASPETVAELASVTEDEARDVIDRAGAPP